MSVSIRHIKPIESQNLVAKKIRHTMSSGLSFIESAVKNITSNRPDLPQALKLHAIGTEKLRTAMVELDLLLNSQQGSSYSDTRGAYGEPE